MGIYSSEVIEICSELDFKYELLHPQDALRVRSLIITAFNLDGKQRSLWEGMKSTYSVHDSDAWKKVQSFFNSEPIYFFFDESSDGIILSLQNSDNITTILGESTGFVFYITDLSCTSLVCFNDHDVLLAIVKSALT